MAYTSFTSTIDKSPERGHHVCGLSRGTNMVPGTYAQTWVSNRETG